MTMLQLIPAIDADVRGKDAHLPALRAGIDSAEVFASAGGRLPKRRRTVSRLRMADMGLRPFRVY